MSTQQIPEGVREMVANAVAEELNAQREVFASRCVDAAVKSAFQKKQAEDLAAQVQKLQQDLAEAQKLLEEANAETERLKAVHKAPVLQFPHQLMNPVPAVDVEPIVDQKEPA